jgi:hypothetical protein
VSGASDLKLVRGVIEDVVHTHFEADDAFRDLLSERADTPEAELRDEALLHARSIAETCTEAWQTAALLARSLPEEALPTYVVEVDQSLAESFVLLAADPYHEDLPSEEVVTAWVTHPLLVQWYTVIAGSTDHALYEILERHGEQPWGEHLVNRDQADAAAELAKVLDPLLAGYRALYADYAAGADVGERALALATMTAQGLRRAKGSEPFLFVFDESTRKAMSGCALLFASLLLMTGGPENREHVFDAPHLDLFEQKLLPGFRLRMESGPA